MRCERACDCVSESECFCVFKRIISDQRGPNSTGTRTRTRSVWGWMARSPDLGAHEEKHVQVDQVRTLTLLTLPILPKYMNKSHTNKKYGSEMRPRPATACPQICRVIYSDRVYCARYMKNRRPHARHGPRMRARISRINAASRRSRAGQRSPHRSWGAPACAHRSTWGGDRARRAWRSGHRAAASPRSRLCGGSRGLWTG